MADVYLSYSHRDRVAAERIAAALRGAGLTVWFDPSLRGNDVASEQPHREIASASTVVVLWSAHSVKSEWVQREVAVAPGHVVSVYIERVERQIMGGMHLSVDLSEWSGSLDEPGFQRLVMGIRLQVDPLPRPASTPPYTTISPPASAPAPARREHYDPFSDAPADRDYDPLQDTGHLEVDPLSPTARTRRQTRTSPPATTSPPAIPDSYDPLWKRDEDYDALNDIGQYAEIDPLNLDLPQTIEVPVAPGRIMVAANSPTTIGAAPQRIRAYLYPKSDETRVDEDAKRLRGTRHTSGQTSVSKIQVGTLITVIINLPDVECRPQRRRFVWRGRWHKVDFRVRYLGEQAGQTSGEISWFAGVVCIGQLSLKTKLSNEYEKSSSSWNLSGVGYESVFVSYSTKDSAFVDWLETTYTALGMTYLRDIKTLRSGEKWDETLLKLIQGATSESVSR
jgi:TIR domain